MIDELNIVYVIRTYSPFMIESLQSLERIRIPYRLIVIEERNHRWAQAINEGLDKVENGPVLIMEEDVIIPPDKILTDCMLPDNNTIWSGLLLTGVDIIGHGGAMINLESKEFNLIHGLYSELITSYPRQVDILSGSFLYLPEEAWTKVRPKTLPGLGWEDIAWQLELKKDGFKCWVLPLKIFHFCQMAQGITTDVQKQIQANFGLIQKMLKNK